MKASDGNTQTDTQFQDRITVIGFWGNDLESKKSDAFNLNHA